MTIGFHNCNLIKKESVLKLAHFLFFINLNFNIHSQNLVPNGDFELHKEFGYDMNYNASPSIINSWQIADCFKGDIIFYCNNTISKRNNENILDHFDESILQDSLNHGLVKVFYFPSCPEQNSCTNYLYTKTKEPLLQGKVYEIKMNVFLPNNSILEKNARLNIGFHLCQNLEVIKIKCSQSMLNVPFFSSEVKYGSWTQIKKIIQVNCDLNYIVIGLFKNEIFPLNHEFYELHKSHFYLDNISITQLNSVDNQNTLNSILFCKYETEQTNEKVITNDFKTIIYYSNNDFTVNEKANEFSLLQISNININENTLFNLFGSTDERGTLESNKILALNRIRSISQYLFKTKKNTNFKIIEYIIPDTVYKDHLEFKNRKCEIIISPQPNYKIFYFKLLFELQYGSIDSAFRYGMKYLDQCPFDSKIELLFDPRLLKFDQQFLNKLERRIRKEYYAKYKNNISFTLDSLYCMDQYTRTLSNIISKNIYYVKDGLLFDPIFKELDESQIDKSNLNFIQALLKKKKFPTIQEYGRRQNKAIIYSLIHGQDTSMIDEYLPSIFNNCLVGESEWQYYAMLYDRCQLLRNLPQKYGTQMKTISDESNIMKIYKFDDLNLMNQRRQKIGLYPITDTSYSIKILK